MSSGQERTPYVDALIEFAQSDPGRFNVPGHQGGIGSGLKLHLLAGQTGLTDDIPALIEGIDVGDPNPFQEAQKLAAEAWGAKRTWFLINGASQGNQAMCLAVAHMGGELVVQRNVHSSVIDGMIMAGLKPTFAAPELDPDLGVAHCLTPEALAEALDRCPDAAAAVAVSPTYFGACADIPALAEVAHSRGVPLVVDEAWGAHLKFHPDLPPSAIESGADLVISSTHKIVGSLTQSAMIHLASDRFEQEIIDRCISMTESTSPNSLLCGSLDAARSQAAVDGERLLGKTISVLAETRQEIKEIPGLDVLDERLLERDSVAGWDPLRLTIDVRESGSTGYHIAALARDLAGVNLELASDTVAVAVFGMGTGTRARARRLVDGILTALEAIESEPAPEQIEFAPPPPWGDPAMTPRDAFLGRQEVVPFDQAEGRIAAEPLATYPPGIPNVLPGERLTRETLDYITDSVDHGGYVRGAADRALTTLRVIAE
ncbi:MAG: aminotransferase class V-fold PLP-dependent enzyme [Solirubrobacterales bacterium]|nr:aminotransferase class V-fold PLP-dependent enzyme [Solirubrobacterales bacterium]